MIRPARRGSTPLIIRWLDALAGASALLLVAAGCTAANPTAAKPPRAPVAKAVSLSNVQPMASISDTKEADGSNAAVPTPTAPPTAAPAGSGTAPGSFAPQAPRVLLTLRTQADLARDSISVFGKGEACVDVDVWRSEYRRVMDFGMPEAVSAGASAQGCVQNTHRAEVTLTYRIAGSKDLLWIHGLVPSIGDNILQCAVVNDVTRTDNLYSPYTCGVGWTNDGGHGNDPRADVTLSKKQSQTVTDTRQARGLLDTYCKESKPECAFAALSQNIRQSPSTDWRLLQAPVTNCYDDNEKHDDKIVTRKTFGWENKLGVEVGVDWKLVPKVVSVSVKVTYEHTWKEEYEYTQEVTAPVPKGYTHYFWAQQGFLRLDGTFTITLRDRVYVIPNAQFDLPLKSDYKGADGRVIPAMVIQSRIAPTDCTGGPTVAPATPPASSMTNVNSQMTVGK